MKKALFILLAGIASCNANARESGFVSHQDERYTQGGFSGPAPSQTTAARAKTLPDDAWVVLEGELISQTGHELYAFRDSSGTVTVDIDDKRWMGQNAAHGDAVHVEGEVDRDWNRIEIDVKNILVRKKAFKG
nr:YgiW/YdeI family stress tolerance OB fold protein [Pantoea sp. 201603H]